MLEDLKQNELDLAEEKLIRSLFNGSLEPSPIASLVFKTTGFDPNKVISSFEGYVKPFMTDTGLLDCSRLRTALRVKNPRIADLLPMKTVRLSDLAEELAPIIQQMIYGR
ncbi:MAG: hypothetical protein J6Q39_03995 [Bacteroidales bacterium]|nr:hypothetical protein [Bacteroidales bacterium]